MGKLVRFRGAPAGHGGENERWMFDGLEGLAVVIEDLDPIAEAAGLTRTGIQLLVERHLASAGIPVAPIVGLADDAGNAVLYVAIGTERVPTGPVAFFPSLQVCETAALARNPVQCGGVTTWSTIGVWTSSRGDVERVVTAAIDEGLAKLEGLILVERDA